ncbi:hypothetical protein [Neobacillus sp. D3-1R]|uniref:hypothetical protein n=1 Tax=Neobacillus sp. D3-1R TaxID=3445778 RepID=UPI003F9ED355
MSNKNRLLIIVFLSFITVFLFLKGVHLWSLGTAVDGDGVGIHFFGIEINDHVTEESIPSYAIGFFIASLITFSISLLITWKTFRFKDHTKLE